MGKIPCPKCGREGWQTVGRFKAKGRDYYYVIVVHPDKRKCIIKPAEGLKPKREDEELERLVEQLKAENEELKRRVELLEKEKAEAEARSQAVRYILASALLVNKEQIEAVRQVYVLRRGYTESQREAARTVMTAFIERGLHVGHVLITFPPQEHLPLLTQLLSS